MYLLGCDIVEEAVMTFLLSSLQEDLINFLQIPLFLSTTSSPNLLYLFHFYILILKGRIREAHSGKINVQLKIWTLVDSVKLFFDAKFHLEFKNIYIFFPVWFNSDGPCPV